MNPREHRLGWILISALGRRQAGSALGRWLNVMLVLVIVSTLMQMFVIDDPRHDGDAFNEVVGIAEDDTDIVGIGVGSEASVFVSDDEAARVKDPRSADLRTRVHPAGTDPVPVLETVTVLRRKDSSFVCSGKVVDEAGQPIPGSTVDWAEHGEFMPDLVLGVGPGQYALRGLTTAKDGSFELWTPHPSRKKELLLLAKAPGHALRGPFRFRSGTKDLRVVMYPAGSVHGSLILPKGMDRSWILAGLLETRRGSVVSSIPMNRWGGACDWSLDPVPAGRYTLRIAYFTMDQPILELQGVEVQAGKECRDVRIQKLDLRAFLKMIRVRVVPKQRKGPLQCTVFCRTSDGAKDRSGRSIRLGAPGMASFGIPAAGAHLRVEAKGYETIDRSRVTRDTTFELVRLAALQRVEIRLARGFPENLPAAIWMELVPAAGSGPRLAAKSFTLEGSFCFPEVRPGPYKARIYLKAVSGMDAPRLLPDRDQLLQVRSVDERQEWKVSFDHGRLLRFAEEGRQRMNAPRRRR